MPRIYLGARVFKDYSEETLEKCLEEVLEGKISATQASKKILINTYILININCTNPKPVAEGNFCLIWTFRRLILAKMFFYI